MRLLDNAGEIKYPCQGYPLQYRERRSNTGVSNPQTKPEMGEQFSGLP